ncbi:membrane protein, Lom/All family [Escherichia coli]|nr:membrane protein, Lom/All family [Escherichia coli]
MRKVCAAILSAAICLSVSGALHGRLNISPH